MVEAATVCNGSDRLGWCRTPERVEEAMAMLCMAMYFVWLYFVWLYFLWLYFVWLYSLGACPRASRRR